MLGSAGFDFVLTAKTKQAMAELHHVLDALNALPYNFDLTAVTLRCEETWLMLTSLDAKFGCQLHVSNACCSEKPPHALIQLLDTVVSTFSSLHKVEPTACMPTYRSGTPCHCVPCLQAQDGGQELVEQTVARILAFLQAVKYPQLPTP